jgi:hypothetical protein
MRRARQLALGSPAASGALAAALLGPEHPLVQASGLLDSIARQCVVVVAVLVGGIAARIAGYAWAWTLILGAGVVLSILALLAVGFQQCKRDHAIDLILMGYQNFPIAAVQDQRRRLLSARTRLRLARSLIQMANEISQRPRRKARGSMPLFHPQTIAEAVDELLEVAHALATEEVSAQGIARAERLITDGASPFYGHDSIVLRAELHRIGHDLLAR